MTIRSPAFAIASLRALLASGALVFMSPAHATETEKPPSSWPMPTPRGPARAFPTGKALVERLQALKASNHDDPAWHFRMLMNEAFVEQMPGPGNTLPHIPDTAPEVVHALKAAWKKHQDAGSTDLRVGVGVTGERAGLFEQQDTSGLRPVFEIKGTHERLLRAIKVDAHHGRWTWTSTEFGEFPTPAEKLTAAAEATLRKTWEEILGKNGAYRHTVSIQPEVLDGKNVYVVGGASATRWYMVAVDAESGAVVQDSRKTGWRVPR